MKKFITALLLAVTLIAGGQNVLATENVGYLNISLSYNPEDMSAYKDTHDDGDGVYVFVQNIEDNTIYRYPLLKDNDYSGTYEIEYGNYKVIPNPDMPNEIYVDYTDVFAISDNNPSVEIHCNMKIPKETESLPKETTSPTSPPETKKTNTERTDSPFQRIVTLICIGAVIGLWIYNRKKK